MASKYKKFTHLEHILARPDTYIGSLVPDVSKQWIVENELMVEKSIQHVPGLFKIFDEILVNAVDHSSDISNNVDRISVSVKDNRITITNSGIGIPIETHPDTNMFIPEMIFGELLTSSNYDDNDDRLTGGRNGYGAKLANVFSTYFEVDIGSLESKKRYVQSWENNMTKKNKAKITNFSKKNGYTSIIFEPDLIKFNLTTLTDDMVKLFERRTYDVCACTSSQVKVYFNGKHLQFKTFEKYVDLYIGDKKQTERIHCKSERWEVIIAPSSHGFKQVSFVNGINTTLGGSHVDYVMCGLNKRIIDTLSVKNKECKLKPQHIKDNMFLFIKSVLVNPSFSSQTKTECTSRYKDFGSRFEFDELSMKKILKMQMIQDALALAKYKEQRELSKTDGRKVNCIRGIPKLEDANKAGTASSSDCTLILTEGDSAKTFAISGLSVIGRDKFGVFPLKGKLLNVRDASPNQLLNNEEINNIKKILGLQIGKVYTNVHDLRYGKVMILTDADVDGAHIKGLFINFIHFFWPSLVKINFITCMRTPILKASKMGVVHSFYSQHEFDMWNVNQQGWSIKYYKGLGTSTSNEAKEYFRSLKDATIQYTSNNDQAVMELAFKKTFTNERKQWITDGIVKKQFVLPHTKSLNLKEFVDRELVWFSIADNERSIPSMMDGFKPSQRKVLYACRIRSNVEIKVSQLSGIVSSATSYHHGEQSLMGTIINMAQEFVGTNNIPFLKGCGQFGTRLMGGKDAASPRYIFTHLTEHVQFMFDKQDDPILKYNTDDGKTVEPIFFVPLLPTILINGCEGIGTGYSSYIPCYNPKDIHDNVMLHLNNKQMNKMVPWYNGFRGSISEMEEGKFLCKGVWNMDPSSDNVLHITELPVGKWTSEYKDFLETLVDKHLIKKVENYSSETSVHFKVTLFGNHNLSDFEKTFKLQSTINTSNMTAFNANGTIERYNSPLEIIRQFVNVKLHHYDLRKTYLLKIWSQQIQELKYKIKFMHKVMDDEIIVFRKSKSCIIQQLAAHHFPSNIHDSLLNITISAFTSDHLRKLDEKYTQLNADVDTLQSTSLKALWTDELKNLSVF